MAASPKTDINQYGVFWPWSSQPISIELKMIKLGGRWKKKDGTYAGNGLPFHFKALIKLLWPRIVWHKWLDMFVDQYCQKRTIVAIGPASSGKTFNAALCALTDYYSMPSATTTIICSTTRERLEDRIWGEIKSLHKEAKQRWPWLPGNIIEGRQRIVTDSRDESSDGRDFRNGVIGVPCKRGGDWVGLGDFIGIKNKRVRLIGDECFPAGTLVDTPSGSKRIERIKPGDFVIGPNGKQCVLARSERTADSLIGIRLIDGRSIVCTPNHRFLTQIGWKKACEINEGCYMLSAYEAMQIMRRGNLRYGPSTVLSKLCKAAPTMQSVRQSLPGQPAVFDTAFLQSVLQCELSELDSRDAESYPAGFVQSPHEIPQSEPRFFRTHSRTQARASLDARATERTVKDHEGPRHKAVNSRWKRVWTNETGTTLTEDVSTGDLELSDQDWQMERERISPRVQSRPGFSKSETGHRGGRLCTQQSSPTRQGREEGCSASGSWVDCVTILQQGDPGFSQTGPDSRRCRVYNLQVTGHPSYSVSGLLAHNCHLLPKVFVEAISNLDKNPDFKCVGLGNPKETTDALGVLAEPAVFLGGWEGGIDQTEMSKVWEIRRREGVCIQYVGTESPNLDGKLGIPLITQEAIDRDISFYGKDSLQFTMMNLGMMPRGQGSRRVITRQMCDKFGALDQPLWRNSNRVKIGGLDAAYRGVGGDRCVFCHLEFGVEAKPIDEDLGVVVMEGVLNQRPQGAGDKFIIALVEMLIVPIKVRGSYAMRTEEVEDQITAFCMNQCQTRGIPAENFFYDSGMRTSLVSSMTRLWSTATNPIDCGGQPSERMVSEGIDVPCKDYYSKKVTELWFSIRLMIEAGQFRGLTEDVISEGCSREWKMVGNNRIEVETKAEMKAKTGRSPDLFDCLAIACEGARIRGFSIGALAKQRRRRKGEKDWRDELRDKARQVHTSRDLVYR